MGPYYYCWWGGMWIIPLLLLSLVAILLFGRHSFRPPFDRHERDHRDRESPMDVLRYRYAKGEITADEFERIKKDLAG